MNIWPQIDKMEDKVLINGQNSDPNNNFSVEEKVKVDRKKFESLLDGNDTDFGNADNFFGQIMSEFPSVIISWPSKLKAGTKSKKDPHVKISGSPSMVKSARIRILDSLDPRRDRMTLKMDVDWTAHSHIIGKAGASIQSVMDSTGCHVHFPDANRTNTNEKSNQVSIAGTALGVTQARKAIRDLLPVIISFNLILGFGTRSSFLDQLNRVIQLVERLTTTQITLRFSGPTCHTSESTVITVYIRGIYSNCQLVKLGTNLLRNFMNEFIKDEIIFEMNTEISGQHHSFVMGFDKSNIRSIMKTTGAVITFPESSSSPTDGKIFDRLSVMSPPETLSVRKTRVNIKASNVEALLLAFQSIQLYLPLSLTFDLKEGQEVMTSSIEMLSNTCNLNISVKPKPKQNSRTIWIKGAEKDESKLFEARNHLIQEYESMPKPMDSIWLPNELDFSYLRLNDGLDLNDSADMESLNNSISHFNRAPGAERTVKLF